MSENENTGGLIPGAPATAPGGMSRQALAYELRDKHGWTRDQIKPLTGLSEWPRLIDAVVAERQAREDEAKNEEREVAQMEAERNQEEGLCEHGEDPADCAECMFDATGSTDDSALDPDTLMAELTSIRDDQQQYDAEHGLLTRVPGTKDYIFNGHAGAGPSASERWMHCTASLEASRAFLETLTPNQQEQFAVANIAARQGTTAHAAAEVEARVVLGQMDAHEADLTMLELSIVPESDGEAYDEEMAEYITEYTDLVRSYAQDRGDHTVLIESRVTAAVPLTDLHEGEVYEIAGSADCIVLPVKAEPVLVVADLKYGNGIDVDVDENPQVRIYALGALGLLADEEGNLTTRIETVTYHIVQPRLGGVKTWSEPLGDLLQWRDEVLAPRLTAALYGVAEGATFTPSEAACQFCPARGGCAALAEQRVAHAANLFDTINESEFETGAAFPETTSLTDDRLGELLAQITGLIDLHADLKAEAQRRLFRGDAVPGWQLVNYSPPRKWVEGADEALDEVPELWVRKLITPTQAVKTAQASEAAWDMDALESLIEVPDKRPVVAKTGDRRKPWTGRPPESMFDVVPEED